MDCFQKKEHIQIEVQGKSVHLRNANKKHSYIVLSTEPSRKIMKNPQILKEDVIQYSMGELEEVNNRLQGFCCVQFQNCMSQVFGKYEKLSEEGRNTRQVFFTKFNINVNPNDWKIQSQKIQKLSKISNRNTKSSMSANQSKYLQIIPPKDIDAHDIQFILQYSLKQHGPSEKIDTKKNSLIIEYEKQIQIRQAFVINKLSHNKNGNIQLSYWTITHHRPMYTIQPLTLIELPAEAKIKRMILQSSWLVFTTSTEVIFLHLYRPLELFLTLSIQSQELCCYEEDKVIVFQYKYMYFYELSVHKVPHLIAKMKVKKLQPYSFVLKDDTALFGGINYSKIMNEPEENKEILIINNFNVINDKSILADESIKLCQQQTHIPINNIVYIKNMDLFASSCGTNMYIFHLESQNIITKIEMNNYIRRIYKDPLSYNLFSLYLKVYENQEIIKVGFEMCGEQLGTEVQNIKQYGNFKDFTVRNELILTNGKVIQNIHKKQIITSADCLVGEQKQLIRKLCCNEDYLCFLTSTTYEKKIYFIEL